ncbi:MAG TPA: 50S ribosomal protein L23 [Planctomycetota bacterium]|nr:50S ribosomal protein L23 [Planctomycetota bacterium]
MAREPHQIIRRPIVTEKAYDMQGHNTYTFEVPENVNKAEIKDAIESLFDVKVVDVRTMHKRGKIRRRRMVVGRTRRWKKAIVKLSPEHTLEIM